MKKEEKLQIRVKELEQEQGYQRDWKNLYLQEKAKNEDTLKNRYDLLQDNEKRLYNANEQFIEIIKWLINPESTLPTVLKGDERLESKRNF